MAEDAGRMGLARSSRRARAAHDRATALYRSKAFRKRAGEGSGLRLPLRGPNLDAANKRAP